MAQRGQYHTAGAVQPQLRQPSYLATSRSKSRVIYYEPKTINEAIRLLVRYGDQARILAGGIDLISELEGDFQSKRTRLLVNLSKIRALRRFVIHSNSIEIGPLLTLHELSENNTIKTFYGIISSAIDLVGVPELQNMITVGGNILQNNQCWYFTARDNAFPCLRKGESKRCYAFNGDNRYSAIFNNTICPSTYTSDLGVALEALGAGLEITGPKGERTVPFDSFFTQTGRLLTADEIITGLVVPRIQKGDTGESFLKFRMRQAFDKAIVSVAVLISGDYSDKHHNTCRDIRIALGGVSPTPFRATECEDSLRDCMIDEGAAQEAASLLARRARPLSMNGYKVSITRALVSRAILQAWDDFRMKKSRVATMSTHERFETIDCAIDNQGTGEHVSV